MGPGPLGWAFHQEALPLREPRRRDMGIRAPADAIQELLVGTSPHKYRTSITARKGLTVMGRLPQVEMVVVDVKYRCLAGARRGEIVANVVDLSLPVHIRCGVENLRQCRHLERASVLRVGGRRAGLVGGFVPRLSAASLAALTAKAALSSCAASSLNQVKQSPFPIAQGMKRKIGNQRQQELQPPTTWSSN